MTRTGRRSLQNVLYLVPIVGSFSHPGSIDTFCLTADGAVPSSPRVIERFPPYPGLPFPSLVTDARQVVRILLAVSQQLCTSCCPWSSGRSTIVALIFLIAISPNLKLTLFSSQSVNLKQTTTTVYELKVQIGIELPSPINMHRNSPHSLLVWCSPFWSARWRSVTNGLKSFWGVNCRRAGIADRPNPCP